MDALSSHSLSETTFLLVKTPFLVCVCVSKSWVYCTPQNGPIKGNYEILNQGLLQYLPVGINMRAVFKTMSFQYTGLLSMGFAVHGYSQIVKNDSRVM